MRSVYHSLFTVFDAFTSNRLPIAGRKQKTDHGKRIVNGEQIKVNG